MSKYLQEIEFAELFEEKKEIAGPEHKLPILSCTIDGIKNQNERFNKQIASKDNSSYLVAERNEVVLSPLNLWMGGIGIQDICEKGVVSPAYKVFKINSKKIYPIFAKYLIRSHPMIKLYGDVSSSGASIVRRSLDLDLLKRSQVLIPQLNEQKKIAEILTSVDRVIELTSMELDKLKDLKRGMMQELLTSGIGHTKFKDSPIGKIPHKWKCEYFKSFFELQRGFDITKGTMTNGPYEVISSSGVCGYHIEAKVKGAGVVVGRKGNIGEVHFVEKDFWPHDTTLWVTDFKGNNPRYCYHLFINMNLASYGTQSGSPSLNRNDLYTILIPMPSPNEQEKIASILDCVDLREQKMNERLACLKSCKKGLMNDLLTGKVRVKV